MPFSQPGAGCGAEPGAPGQLKERQRSLRVGHEGSKGWKCCSQCPGLVLCCCCSHCGYNNKDAALFLSPQEVPAVWVAVCSPQGLPRARAPSPRMCRVTFAAQGIFPFLPKDGTRIHRNHSAPWICPYLCEIPAGPSRAVSIPRFHNPLEHPALGRPCLDSRRWATAAEGKWSYHLLGVCSRKGCLSLG